MSEPWLRPPKLVEMCSNGDQRRFLCVAERRLNEITGGVFMVTYHETLRDPETQTKKEGLAWRQAFERAKAKAWLPDGSYFTAFDWPLHQSMGGMTMDEFVIAMDELALKDPTAA